MSTRIVRRCLTALATGLVVAAGVSVGIASPAQATAVQYYEVRAWHSDKCLSVDGRGPGGPGADLADVVQYRCHNGGNQYWRLASVGNGYFEVRAWHSDKCLSVDGRGPGGPGADLADVVQYRCHNGGNQYWRLAPISS